ncbi:hypothetical protein [Flagellimonas algicola]|uniref:YokE-like PH domain-containing protein n=1 Tax=Flagellimonas algicola TaxID=2583815 RepID=A0ABY2WR46_9FLAO|nr:hypothetical protein [Allomuricauda algicola]TMU57465.1 hypothetical protein FGG15_07955 [Allomuricauda algicola]
MSIQKLESDVFDLISDLEADKIIFKKDTLPLDDFSTEGGELIIFTSDKKDYCVFDFWLYGEMGKLHYTYWTDTSNTIVFARRISYNYDRPYYKEGFQIDTMKHYLSFGHTKNRLFGKNRQEIFEKKETQAVQEDLRSFFNELTSGIELPN